MTTRNKRPFAGRQIGRREARRLRREVYGEMIRRDRKKYLFWVIGLVLGTKLFLWNRKAVEIMLTIYAVMRKVDDVVDRDAPLPADYASAVEYVERYMHFVINRPAPSDDNERLLAYALNLAEEAGIELSFEVWSILDSLRFDAVRIEAGGIMVLPRKQLLRYQYGRDGRGTIIACLKLARELDKGVRYLHLKHLCLGVRISYDLRDLLRDIEVGFCNIPAEDVRAFRITLPTDRSPQSLERWRKSAQVRSWVVKEAHDALKALDKHREMLVQKPLNTLYWRTLKVLYIMYERPARKRLMKVLDNA